MQNFEQLDIEYEDLPIKGMTMTSVTRGTRAGGQDLIHFVATNGEEYHMTHYQDCCESVDIEDICGDLSDLVGVPLLQAEEATHSGPDTDSTWTFYKFATIKGVVTVRWYGQSNGYYSETADFVKVDADGNRIYSWD